MSYKMARLDEDELECLRKLGEYQHTASYNKGGRKNTNFATDYKMVRLDEDELECLRKLGEDQRTMSYEKLVNSKLPSNYKMVKLDEDEIECLRKLEEDHDTGTYQNVASSNNNGRKMVRIDENSIGVEPDMRSSYNNFVGIRAEKKEGLLDKKLESKKSEDINESAEKFIQSFKQQLLIQRLESIENVDQMLARGL